MRKKNNTDNHSDIIGEINKLDQSEKERVIPILKRIEQYIGKHKNKGEVVSVIPLDDNTIESIKSIIKKKYNVSISLNNKIDKRIIGGIIIRFADIVIDLSIRRQLEEFEKMLYES